MSKNREVKITIYKQPKVRNKTILRIMVQHYIEGDTN